MLTNAGMDMKALAREAEQRRMSAEFDAAEAAADAKAQLDAAGRSDQNVSVVVKGSEEDVLDQFSFVDDEWDESAMRQAAERRLREAKAYGNLQPVGILVDEDGVMQGPKLRDRYEEDAVAKGEFCWRCGDARNDSMPPDEKEARLKMIGWSAPAGITVSDCCATCGAVLGLQQKAG